MALKFRTLTVGPVACNCAVVMCQETGQGAIIDPGGHGARILTVVREMEAEVKLLLHTHGHFDHVLATGEVAAATSARVAIHEGDRELYEHLPRQGRIFGFVAEPPPPPDLLLGDGERIEIGKLTATVLHTPGHTPGSVGLYFETDGVLFAGDTLFAGSIGRTDLPGGSLAAITKSIQDRLYVLPSDTRVIPGHGPETTIADEREHNPFVRSTTM